MPSSARRPGDDDQPVEDRLDLIGAGVPGGHQIEPRAARARPRLRRSARRAPGPPGSRSGRRARARRAAARRGRRTARRRTARPARRRAAARGSRAEPRPGPCRAPGRARARGTPSRRPRTAAPGLVPAAPEPRCRSGPRSHGRSGRWTYLVFNAGGTRGTRRGRRLVYQCPASPSPAAGVAVPVRCSSRPRCCWRCSRSPRWAPSEAPRWTIRREAVPGELIVGFTPSATAWQEQRAVDKARGELGTGSSPWTRRS